MANTVQGKNVIVSMFVGDAYYPVLCARSASLNINQDELETTSINSGHAREYEIGLMNASLSVSGVTILNNLQGRISMLYLIQQSIRRQKFLMKVTLTDNEGTPLVISFTTVMPSSVLGKEMNAYSSSSITFRITGDVSINTLLTAPGSSGSIFSIYIAAVQGDTFVISATLIGKTILQVARSGDTLEKVSGTPGNNQWQFVSATGRINFDPNNVLNAGEIIFVEYQ